MGSVPTLSGAAPVLDIPSDMQSSLLRARIEHHGIVPGLRLNTVPHRQRISTSEQIEYRVKMLRALRQKWDDDKTEAMFLAVANRIESDGCALFGGLIEPAIFEKLVAEYDKVQARAGNNAFMHSCVNLGIEHDFILGGNYIDAFSHPLLIALISYQVGGAIRMVEARGKNTDPISINAQDNMLHVDNTPFKEEYKVLLNWRRGQVKGPSGQNFTFLPWTHKGNREVLVDDEGQPWSSERDSLFVSNAAIDGLFQFQKDLKGVSRVVEARHPEQPLAVLFPAGALVHHRYRTEDGDPRSCIIAAFHLSSSHPGHASELPSIPGHKKTLIEFLLGHQDATSTDGFVDALLNESPRIEAKLHELFEPSHPSRLIELEPLSLHGAQLDKWREAVMDAPSPMVHKFKNNLQLSSVDFSNRAALADMRAAVMDYDKHCNLQMVLYEDGREEIRKPGRKIIGERKKDAILARLTPWIDEVAGGSFSAYDLVEPRTLRVMANAVSALSKNLAQGGRSGGQQCGMERKKTASEHMVGHDKIVVSMSRLMMDLGEAVVRCEGVEAFVVTSLFLFLTAEEIYSHLSESDRLAARFMVVIFLRNYVATVLLVESQCLGVE